MEERQDALAHEMQSLEGDRSLLKQYRDNDTVVDPRAGAGAQVEKARSIATQPTLPALTFPCPTETIMMFNMMGFSAPSSNPCPIAFLEFL